MPLPLLAIPVLIKVGAAVAGAVGVGAAVKGAVDAKKSSDTMKSAKSRNEENLSEFLDNSNKTNDAMEELGKLQADVAEDFERFSSAFEQIQNRPEFSSKDLGVDVPEFDFSQIKASSIAAGVLLGAAAGGAAGAVFGTAAATGLTAAVMALGTASTGTAITALSGAAATKATLAVLGGGTLAAGGGGIAAGTAALGVATLGVGFLVGGVAFALTGSKLRGKAGDAYDAMLENEKSIKNNIRYLARIREAADKLSTAIEEVHNVYDTNVKKLIQLVNREKDWNAYSNAEQLLVENNIRIVSVLHKIINTPLLKVDEFDGNDNPTKTVVNTSDVYKAVSMSALVMAENNSN